MKVLVEGDELFRLNLKGLASGEGKPSEDIDVE